MRRQSRSPEQLAAATRSKLAAIGRSPLQPVYEKLSLSIDEALCGVQAGLVSPDGLDALCSYVGYVIERLPQGFGERFHFDARLIQAICRDVGGTVKLSGMVVPRYGLGYWGHERVLMPSENSECAHVIDLVHFPGRDRIEGIDLLEYPWLLHELGHHIFSRDDSSFALPLTQTIKSLIRSFRLRSIADTGAARLRSKKACDEIGQLWLPTPDHRNWSHELAIDLMALWLCGPAYIACVERVVASKNPYTIEQNHPPYAVRVQALLDAATQLGFGVDTRELFDLQRSWGDSAWDSHRNSRFLTLAHRELIAECARCALAFCDRVGLRKCTPETLNQLRTRTVRARQTGAPNDDLGMDLLLEAHLVGRELGESAYEEWASRRVGSLTKLVM